MRVFLTGATGFIGSAAIHDLTKSGHQVLGLTRSEAGVKALVDAGAEAHQGDIEDVKSLQDGAAQSDGVIHLAFNHDFTSYAAACETDRKAIHALGSALVGSHRPLVTTSGTAVGFNGKGQVITEEDAPLPSHMCPAARRRKPQRRLPHKAYTPLSFASRKSTISSSKVWSLTSLPSPARKVSRPMSEMASTAGPQCTSPMPRASIASHLKTDLPERVITPSPKKACRSATSLKPSAAA